MGEIFLHSTGDCPSSSGSAGVVVSTVLVVAMEDIISSSRQVLSDVLGSYTSMDTAVKLRLGDSCVFKLLCQKLQKVLKGLDTRDHT